MNEITISETLDNLPALVGSPKQVSWAEHIRGQLIAEIDRYNPKVYSHAYLISEISAHTEAHWWIENRSVMISWLCSRSEKWIENR